MGALPPLRAPARVAMEPAVCVASIRGTGGRLSASIANNANLGGLRSIRVLTREDFSAAGCDVLLAVREGILESGPTADHHFRATGARADCGMTAYSAHTRSEVWNGIQTARAGPSCETLPGVLRADLQPGMRIHSLVGTGGAPLTLDEVDALAGPVLTREQLAAKAASAGFERARPIAAAPAAAERPARTRSDVDTLPAAAPARRGHAVIVGIEQYRGRLPKAEFAAADAETMSQYAHAVLGFPEGNIAVLSGDSATRSDLVKYFEKWLANRVEKDDEVFVYFSGHGAPDPKTGDAYLVPYDGDPTYLEETAYPLKSLYAALAKLPTKNVTVALDSCFSGAGGRSVIAKGARPLVAVKAAEAPESVTVIAAAGADQISNTYDEKGHGLFTYFFLKGLKEKGADFKAVFDYLKPEVAKVARREYNADQEPQWREGR